MKQTRPEHSIIKITIIPIFYHFRSQPLKFSFQNSDSHPMEIKQTYLHYNRILKTAR